jgi:hypothetical protein
MAKSKSRTTRSTGLLDPDLALKAFFQDNTWMGKVGLGGMLYVIATIIFCINPLLFPISVSIASFNYGYLLKIIRTKVNNPESSLPDLSDPISLLFSGLSWLAIQSILYLSIGAIFIFIVVASINMQTSFLTAFLLSATLFMIVFGIFINFLSTYLMVNMAVSENVSSGLAFRQTLKIIKNNKNNMLLAWLLSCALQIGSIVLLTLTIIGISVVPYVLYTTQMISCIFFAQVWLASETKPD